MDDVDVLEMVNSPATALVRLNAIGHQVWAMIDGELVPRAPGDAWQGAIPEAECDHCAAIHRTPTFAYLFASNAQNKAFLRIFGFCSKACRGAWMIAGSSTDFAAVIHDGEDGAQFRTDDGEITLTAIFSDGANDPRGLAGVSLQTPGFERPFCSVKRGYAAWCIVFRCPEDVNAWWRAPRAKRLPPVDVIVADWTTATDLKEAA